MMNDYYFLPTLVTLLGAIQGVDELNHDLRYGEGGIMLIVLTMHNRTSLGSILTTKVQMWSQSE